ncbi:hypothetical protein PFAG_05476 [Plasmodium falciparum Santa Lucia]|uniref:SUN domain-containing protein n=5 Tax=Plasmodium falciparum TaxID=5833 RepID=W4IVM6_PLAFP|nr:hypothetical protein PFFVO_05016 [Plasmodium falciparum Vietnam Oak-Knoll (FVO)]ETW54040.1 hypothetical protein PFUGPA_03912 [Plasmodium falciparum Palo Alto/Uganda]ETW58347.1 hypothetical protein PFMC_05450 [Plasmodium falciparum CAMP/Malaysia]EUR62839.1 hypothetical protein PFBG_05445 [Plasmodium falciparum 7G8]EUT78899.1 hypothetical protein PFAG_05476 [Plasmodium falciparum Santa Lucia]
MIWWFLISVNFLFFLIKSFFTPKATIYRNDLNTNYTNSSTEKYILGENYNLTSLKLKIDFGSLDTGTKIIEYSKGIINIRSIQQYDYDSYMLTPCNSDIWWIYSFSDIIHIEKIGLVSLEHYASNFKVIEILGSDVYPATKWKKLGKISTNFTKSFELFNIYEYCKNYDEDNCWVKYLKFHVLSHHNLENNYYCTLTHLQIFASSGVDMLSDKIYSDENINKIEKDLQDNYMDQNNEQLYDQEIIENLEELYENNESLDDTLSNTSNEKKSKTKTSTNDDNDKIHGSNIYYDNIKKNDEKKKKKKEKKSTRTQAKSLDTKLIDKDLMNTKQIEKELLDTKLIENEFIHNKLFDTDMIEKELMDTELIENELMNYELFDKDTFFKENYFNDEQQRTDESNVDQQNDMYVIKNNKDSMKGDYYIKKKKKKLVTDNTKDLNKCSSYKSSKRDKFFENIKRENHMDDQHNENIYINIKNNKSTHTYKKKNNHIFHKNVYYNILIVLYYLFNQHIKKELYHFNMLKNKMQSSFFMNRFYITTRYKYLNKKYINFINFIKVLKENHEQKLSEYYDNDIYQKLYIKQEEQKKYIYNLIMNTQNKYEALIKLLPFSSIQFLLKRKKWIPLLYTMYNKKEFVKNPYFSIINRGERKKRKKTYTIMNDDYIPLNTFYKKNHIIILHDLIYSLFFSNILCNGDLVCLFENKILLSKVWISRSNIKHFITTKYIFDNYYYNDKGINKLKNIYLSPHFYFFRNIFISHKFQNKIYLKFPYYSYYDKKGVLKYMHNNINMNDFLYTTTDVDINEFIPYSRYKNYEYEKERVHMIEREKKKKKMYKRKPYENYMILYVIYRLKANNIYHFEFIKYCTNLINNWSKKEIKKNKHLTLLYNLERKYLSTFYNKMKCVDIYKSYKILKKKRVFVGAHHHIFNNEYNNNDNNSSNTCRRDKLINDIYKYLQKRNKLNYIPILHNNIKKKNEIQKIKKQQIKMRENIFNRIILFFHKFVFRKLPYIYFLNFWIYNKNDMIFQMNDCLDILFNYIFNNIKRIIIIKKKKKKNLYIFLEKLVTSYIKQNCFLKKNFSSLFLKKRNKKHNRHNNKRGYINMNKNYIILYLHYYMEKSKLRPFHKYLNNIEMSYYIKTANNKNYMSLSDIYFFSKNKEYYLTNYITWYITNMIFLLLNRKEKNWKVDINKEDIYKNEKYFYDNEGVDEKEKINAYRKMNMIPNYLYNNDSYNDEYFYYDDDDDNDNDNIGNNNFYNNNVLYRDHYQYDNDNKNSYLNYYLTNRIIINHKKNFLENVCLTIGDMENIIYSNYYIDKFEKKDSKYDKCMKNKIKENIIYDEDKDSHDSSSIKILNEIKKNEESNNKLIHDVYDIISEYDDNVSNKYRDDDKNVENNHKNTYKRNKQTSKNISVITGKKERNENIKVNQKRKEQIKKTKKINFIEEFDNKIIDENLNFPNEENCIREEKIEEKSKNTRGHALLTLVDKIKTIETKNNYLLTKLRDIIKITNNKTKIIYHMLSNFKILQNTISLLLKYIMINEKHMKDLNMNKKNSDTFYKILKEICLEQINDKSKNMDSLKYLCKYLQNFLYDEFERKYLFEKIRPGNYPMCDDDQNILLHNKNGYHQKNTDFIIKEKKKSLFNFLYYENHCHNDIFKTPLIYYNSQVDRLQTVYLNIFNFIVNLKVVKFLIYKFKYWKNIFKRYIINGLSYNINPHTFMNYSPKDNHTTNNNMNNTNNVMNNINNNNSNYHYENWYQIFTNNFYVIFFYILFIIFIVNNFLCFMFYKHLSNKLNAYVKTCTCHNK